MRLVQYIKLDRDDIFTKCCKVFGYLASCFGFVLVVFCPLICESLSGPKTLLYALCFSAYLADLLWMRQGLKPRLSKDYKNYLDNSGRLKNAISHLK